MNAGLVVRAGLASFAVVETVLGRMAAGDLAHRAGGQEHVRDDDAARH